MGQLKQMWKISTVVLLIVCCFNLAAALRGEARLEQLCCSGRVLHMYSGLKCGI